MGLRNVSTPWPMNTADSRGRAILRINMAGVFPACPVQTGPAGNPSYAGWGRLRRSHSGNTTQKPIGRGSARPGEDTGSEPATAPKMIDGDPGQRQTHSDNPEYASR